MLTAGARLGPYAIVSPLGAGGMGEVYAATDTRLGRKVALKVLPPDLAGNPERRARFEREARSIAKLEHPHICTLHDVGENYLVMELLEGETLAQRLARGPLPLAEIVRYGSEIAEALEKAHRAGVVHRDLKPSNVMLTKTGAKLLDFGLAKISGMVEVSPDSRTRDASVTSEGRIVGSFPYMAPEQVEGRAVDPRADIFALGAILYEMATGRLAFEGETHAAVISAILAAQPAAVSASKPSLPVALDRVIAKCLEKEPEERWQSAKDVAVALRWAAETPPPAAVQRRHITVALVVAMAALAAVAVLIAVRSSRALRDAPDTRQLEVTAPAPAWIAWAEMKPFAVSPDGRTLAFVAGNSPLHMSLHVRDLTAGASIRIEGTERAFHPFWSEGGNRIAFFQEKRLMQLSLADLVPQQIAQVERPGTSGASWSRSGGILFANERGVYHVEESGGTPRRILAPRDGISFCDPDFLPDGEHFLLTRVDGNGRPSVEVRLLGSTGATVAIDDASNASWSATGHVLFVRSGALLAQRFDPVRLKLEGEAAVIAKRVGQVPHEVALFSAARNGRVLAIQPSAARETELMHFGRGFELLESLAGPAVMHAPALSHDATRVAVAIEDDTGSADIWIVDRSRRSRIQLPTGPGYDWSGVWSPDDRFLAYGSDGGLYRIPAGGGQPELLFPSDRPLLPTDWSPDGGTILVNDSGDISAFRLAGRRLEGVIRTPQFVETSARFSPDGAWITYTATDTGAREVYVQRFRDGAFKTRLSSNHGAHPVWTPDGRQVIFYPNSAVDVTLGDPLVVSEPRQAYVSTAPQDREFPWKRFDLLPDGTFVTLILPAGQRGNRPIQIRLDWTTALPRRRTFADWLR